MKIKLTGNMVVIPINQETGECEIVDREMELRIKHAEVPLSRNEWLEWIELTEGKNSNSYFDFLNI